jgi:hypothetical protein
MGESPTSVQLEGELFEQARWHARRAQEHLLELSKLVLTTLQLETTLDEVSEIQLRPNNIRVTQLNARMECVAVYEDPPGICRGC